MAKKATKQSKEAAKAAKKSDLGVIANHVLGKSSKKLKGKPLFPGCDATLLDDGTIIPGTTVIGKDAKGQAVHEGDLVNHTEKPYQGGIVLKGGQSYQGEPACAVKYPQLDEPWLNRFSKLTVIKAS